MSSRLPIEHIVADEHALAKLRVIEAAQNGKDFLVSFSAPGHDDMGQLARIKETLDNSNYSTYQDRGLQGEPVLRARYIGKNSTLDEAIDTLGAIGGCKHIADRLIASAHDGGDVLRKAFDKPIKLLAGFYTMADVLNLVAGQHQASQANAGLADTASNPAWRYDLSERGINNISGDLYSSVGAFSMAQAFVFSKYGQDANVRELHELGKSVDNAVAAGTDPYEIILKAPDVKEHLNVIDKVDGFLRKYPVQTGAGLWITGQLAQAASGGIRLWQTRDDEKKEGIDNIIRAAISIAGWSMMLVEEQQQDDKVSWKANPLQRAMQEFRETPHRFASMTMIAASLQGIKASHADNNPYQRMQEICNITGDVALMFAPASEYGEASSENMELAAKAAVDFMSVAPMVFTPIKEVQFAKDMAHYMAERSVNSKLDYRGNLPDDAEAARQEAITDMEQGLTKHILSELSGKEKRINKIANTIARISELFPEAFREAVQHTLSYEVAKTQCVYADAGELNALVAQEFNRFANLSESPASAPSISVVADALAELTHQLPPLQAGQNAAQLFDALAEYVRSTPVQKQLFETALNQQLAKQLGISPHMLQHMVAEPQQDILAAR